MLMAPFLRADRTASCRRLLLPASARALYLRARLPADAAGLAVSGTWFLQSAGLAIHFCARLRDRARGRRPRPAGAPHIVWGARLGAADPESTPPWPCCSTGFGTRRRAGSEAVSSCSTRPTPRPPRLDPVPGAGRGVLAASATPRCADLPTCATRSNGLIPCWRCWGAIRSTVFCVGSWLSLTGNSSVRLSRPRRRRHRRVISASSIMVSPHGSPGIAHAHNPPRLLARSKPRRYSPDRALAQTRRRRRRRLSKPASPAPARTPINRRCPTGRRRWRSAKACAFLAFGAAPGPNAAPAATRR